MNGTNWCIMPLSQAINRLNLPISAVYHRSFGNKAQNANFSAKEQHQKLHDNIYRQYLIQTFVQK